jgi:hypothetical protein
MGKGDGHRASLLSAAFILGLVFPPPSFSEIYKYGDQDGVVHLPNVPDGRQNLVLNEGWSSSDSEQILSNMIR